MNSSLINTPSIQAYFSHSYRKDDREVNLFFWKLFYDNGFFFAIDPKSDDNSFNITYLERLMRSSDCFIAVVTRRKKQSADGRVSGYTHSRYIAFENFLAELAEKPRIVFVEWGLDKNVFGAGDSGIVHTFRRDRLEIDESQFKEILQDFSSTVKNYKSYTKRFSQMMDTSKVGILIQASQDSSGYSQETIELIENLISDGINYSSEILSPRVDNGLQRFIRSLSEFNLVVVDICDPYVTPEVIAIIQTKALPCVRLAKSGSSEAIEKLKSKGVLKDYFIESDSPLIVWNDVDELKNKLEAYLNKFNQELERIFFKTYDSGFKYFKGAGRRTANIFISNPASLQPIASKLSKQLEDAGIENHFQYRAKSSIEIGKLWKEELEKLLRNCNIFVALINDDYQKSEYCLNELRIAVQRQNEGVVIQAYQCAGATVPELIRDLQYQDLRFLSDDEIASMISKEIEEELDKPETAIKKRESSGKITVLFLASNPAQTAYLNLTTEVEEIDKKVRSSEFREKLNLEKHFEQKPGDVRENLLYYKPTVVHFSGHGEQTGELLLMDNNGQPVNVSPQALKTLFTNLKENIQVVVLNACYSKTQALAISEVIDFAVGMNLPISDNAAIAFSTAFYQAIGYGKTIQEAFNLGKNAISLEGMLEEDTPELFVRIGADPTQTRLIS